MKRLACLGSGGKAIVMRGSTKTLIAVFSLLLVPACSDTPSHVKDYVKETMFAYATCDSVARLARAERYNNIATSRFDSCVSDARAMEALEYNYVKALLGDGPAREALGEYHSHWRDLLSERSTRFQIKKALKGQKIPGPALFFKEDQLKQLSENLLASVSGDRENPKEGRGTP